MKRMCRYSKGLITWRWGPQVGEVPSGGSPPPPPPPSCERDQVKMRDYMDWRVTSATWDSPPPYKQALR